MNKVVVFEVEKKENIKADTLVEIPSDSYAIVSMMHDTFEVEWAANYPGRK